MKNQIPWSTVGMVAAWYGSNIGVLLLNKYLLSKLRVQVPGLPHPLPHDRLLATQLRCHCVHEGGAHADHQVRRTAPQDRRPQRRVLLLRRLRERVVEGEPSFHLFGFIMCVSATAARALKSVVQDILLSSDGEKLNSMNLLLYMAPIAVVFLFPAALLMEENVVKITVALARKDIKIVWYLLFNSSLAYFVNLTNFLVTKHTSALTLQVLGNAKGAVAVVVSILIFKNPISVIGMAGYGLTVVGVVMYSEAKKKGR
ncbi:hypothetical protein FH972_017265 [Carpinus fangiana]|uniref:Sugar phosphate transporter domain-containing protein n=1 Tax=Carpinus fangiana TaxID=176857 RepID=A0A5N6RIN9_9ROSI|nr:hypothetical protein FH972_017265 [Carpinus fangiana]